MRDLLHHPFRSFEHRPRRGNLGSLRTRLIQSVSSREKGDSCYPPRGRGLPTRAPGEIPYRIHFRVYCKKGFLPQRSQSTRRNNKEELCALCVLCGEFFQWTHFRGWIFLGFCCFLASSQSWRSSSWCMKAHSMTIPNGRAERRP